MNNAISQKRIVTGFESIGHTLTVISFNENGYRTLTYGKCNLYQAMRQMLDNLSKGETVKVYQNLPRTFGHHWHIKNYKDADEFIFTLPYYFGSQ